MQPLRVTRSGLLGTLLVFVVAAICVRLGIWQLHRLHERRERNARIEARIHLSPIGLDRLPTDTAGLEYRPAIARGHYDNAHSIVFAGRSYDGVPGVYLLTPLLMEGGGGALLVNRGWLPSPDAATVDLAPYAVTGAVSADGILLPMPSSARAAAVDTFRTVWYHPDARDIRRQFPYPVAPVYLQQLPAPGTPVRPHRLPPPALDEGPHLSYAIQWFSFATIGIIGWAALVLRRGRPHEAQETE